MKDNEIIKALECCIDFVSGGESMCNDCPLHDYDNCSSEQRKQALDLINRLKADANNYRTRVGNQREELARLNEQVNEQKVEIENLERTVSHLEDYSNGIADKVKSEAIKEITDGLVTMFLNINESLNCEDIVENIKRFSSRLTEGRENDN
jgi:predicted nuclease with TOPRIM domain